MQKGQLFFLGRIVSTKGIKGELKASLDVDNPADYSGLDAVFVEKKKELVPFVVSRISIEQKKATLKLEGIDSIEAAQSLVKCLLFLPLDFQLADLIGHCLSRPGNVAIDFVGNIEQ